MSLITENGTIQFLSPVTTGTSKNGNEWQKQTIVVARDNEHEAYNKVVLSAFNDKVNEIKPYKVGSHVFITYSVSAREYNGKWYNDVSLFKIGGFIDSANEPIKKTITSHKQNVELEPQEGDLPF